MNVTATEFTIHLVFFCAECRIIIIIIIIFRFELYKKKNKNISVLIHNVNHFPNVNEYYNEKHTALNSTKNQPVDLPNDTEQSTVNF